MMLYCIDDMPLLKAQLGKARTDRIRYLGKEDSSLLPRSQNVRNTILTQMQGRQVQDLLCGVTDVIEGIARLDHQGPGRKSIPLSTNRLYAILQCMEVINTREVMTMLGVDKRQAQKYVRACKLIIQHLETYPFPSDTILYHRP